MGLILDQRRNYSTKMPLDVKILDHWWVTGYTDGEGCFTINTIKSKSTKLGYTVKLHYQISVHHSDEAILHALKAFFKDAGYIVYSEHYVAYRVEKLSDILNYIIPHFTAYPLQSTKFIPFYLFKVVANLIDKKAHLTLQGYREILTYKAALKKGLAASVFQASELFSDIEPFNTEGIFIEKESVLEPEYISGFVAADGTFFISKPSAGSKWPNYDATFAIAQNQRDEALLHRIIKTLGCGGIKKDSHGMRNVSVRNKEDLQHKVIPFFSQYPIRTEKHKYFLYFQSAVSILHANKGKGLKSLTEDQRNHLNFYISNMNKNRYAIP